MDKPTSRNRKRNGLSRNDDDCGCGRVGGKLRGFAYPFHPKYVRMGMRDVVCAVELIYVRMRMRGVMCAAELTLQTRTRHAKPTDG